MTLLYVLVKYIVYISHVWYCTCILDLLEPIKDLLELLKDITKDLLTIPKVLLEALEELLKPLEDLLAHLRIYLSTWDTPAPPWGTQSPPRSIQGPRWGTSGDPAHTWGHRCTSEPSGTRTLVDPLDTQSLNAAHMTWTKHTMKLLNLALADESPSHIKAQVI